MEAISRVIKVQLPNYLRSLPVPSTFGGFLKLSGKEWGQLAPLLVSVSLFVYVVISSLMRSTSKLAAKKPDQDWVNKTQQKEKEKVADTIQIEDLAEKAAYHAFCRCWKSKKFPRCDGSHTQHNKETGDNVGPVVLKGKKACSNTFILTNLL
ncbi:CDGSH iron-sulfur domain-containing protein 2 [Desmophyllum pertusum]|uniref:CDGSH iron-sulfur domain-containing protein 2 homologue n=1 Tax=Desmophyllum pertusum TaxID=174260 RepID=A0A9X0CEY1_9CNID|nr:CDGSH iron-sulfur domain-containing protein 2 [Desmophyllum pertusum]